MRFFAFSFGSKLKEAGRKLKVKKSKIDSIGLSKKGAAISEERTDGKRTIGDEREGIKDGAFDLWSVFKVTRTLFFPLWGMTLVHHTNA